MGIGPEADIRPSPATGKTGDVPTPYVGGFLQGGSDYPNANFLFRLISPESTKRNSEYFSQPQAVYFR